MQEVGRAILCNISPLKAHALKTLVNLVTVPALRAAMLEQGLVRLTVRALETVHAAAQPEASALLLAFVSGGDAVAERAQAEVAGELRALTAWVEGWAGIREKDDRLRIYSAALANVLQVLAVCCRTRPEEGRRLIPSVCSVLPISRPECEAQALAFLLLFLEDAAARPALLEQAEKLAGALESRERSVLTRGALLLAPLLAEPALQARESLWRKINPVSVVELLADADPRVRAAAVALFALVAAQPGAAAGLQRDASSFAKLGDALLADASLSRQLTASLASLSTVPEIK